MLPEKVAPPENFSNFPESRDCTLFVDHDNRVDISNLISSPSPSVLPFPATAQLVADEIFTSFAPLLPARLLQIPRVPKAGHRIRARWKLTRDKALHVNEVLRCLNRMDSGLRNTRAQRRTATSSSMSAASLSLYRRLWGLATSVVLVRRDPTLVGLSGARSTATLLKTDQLDRYTFATKNHMQVPIIADAMDEPGSDWPTVDMLDCLPSDEAQFYKAESNVVQLDGKSDVLFSELQLRYGFVGGELGEYLRYFNRTDIDPGLWDWSLQDGVKCVVGFSSVSKKDKTRQRKLLMTCASNYLWCDARERSELGMHGGGGLASTFAAEGCAHLAGWDQSNAFTTVRVPDWFWPWQAAPPVRAKDVFDRLPASLQRRVSPMTWVFPRYTRLAMGNTHSVHILMTMNIEICGRALLKSARLGTFRNEEESDADGKTYATDDLSTDASVCSTRLPGSSTPLCQPCNSMEEDLFPDEEFVMDEDVLWAKAHLDKRLAAYQNGLEFEHALTLSEFLEACKRFKRNPERTFVVGHAFAGKRRSNDFQAHLEKAMAGANLRVLVISIDLGADSNWDLACPDTFHALHEATCQGLVDMWGGGPPCATWSKLRFLEGGPRPVRSLAQPWGLTRLSATEHDRVMEANILLINFWSLCETAAMRGGLYFFEHPDEPEETDLPSSWRTNEFKAFEARVGGARCHFDQCALGAPTRKPTCISHNLESLRAEEGPKCPGDHWHERSRGRMANGVFRSQRLSAYPAGMCQWLASHVVASFLNWAPQGLGPTGWLKRVRANSANVLVVADDFSVLPVVSHEQKVDTTRVSKWSSTGHSRYDKIVPVSSEDPNDFVKSIKDVSKNLDSVKDSDLPISGIQHCTHWSSASIGDKASGTCFINEAPITGRRATIDVANSAFYVHVDDGLFLAHSKDRADELMNLTGDALADAGFTVTDRSQAGDLKRVVGYEILENPPGLCFPRVKAEMLRRAMKRAASQRNVSVEVVRSLLGIWLFGALLKRELLSAAAAIFKFVDKFETGLHRWWPSARLEFLAMSDLIIFMTVDFSLPAARILFASDARGADDGEDSGGYGIVGLDVDANTIKDCWKSSFHPGKAVTKLDGSLGNKWSTRKDLCPTVPFARLPKIIFEQEWVTLQAGQWRYRDHICAGEARAHFKLLQSLAACSVSHNHRLILLQDNQPVACSMSKGRATAPILNYYCRRRAAHQLAANIMSAIPWVETSLMPADSASRLLPEQLLALHAELRAKHGILCKTADSALLGSSSAKQAPAKVTGPLSKRCREVHGIYH